MKCFNSEDFVIIMVYGIWYMVYGIWYMVRTYVLFPYREELRVLNKCFKRMLPIYIPAGIRKVTTNIII